MNQTLTGLFIVSFLSATLLPGTSEITLTGILATSKTPAGLVILAATLGNTAGACVNWAIGRFFSHFRHAGWFPVPPDRFERYQRWYEKWGIWSLLASWAPVIGDPLTVMAGIARTRFWLFVMIVLIAKAARYLALAGILNIAWPG